VPPLTAYRRLGVVGDDDIVIIRRAWRTSQRIPIGAIIAVTNYPSIIWRTRSGRLRRARTRSLYKKNPRPSSNRYWPDRDWARVDEWIYAQVSALHRHTRLHADQIDIAQLAEHLAAARKALAWTDSHPWASGPYSALWTLHVRGLEGLLDLRR